MRPLRTHLVASWRWVLLSTVIGLALSAAGVLIWASYTFDARPMTVIEEVARPVATGIDLEIVASNDGTRSTPTLALQGPASRVALGVLAPGARRVVPLDSANYGEVGLVDDVGDRWLLVQPAPDADGMLGRCRLRLNFDGLRLSGTVTTSYRLSPRHWGIFTDSHPLVGVASRGR